MKKQFAALMLAMLIGLTPAVSFANVIDESRYQIPLSQGVNLKKVSSFYEWGVQNINILEVDLNNPSVKLDVLFNKSGFINRTTLSNMVNQEQGVVAAVNGDFFSMSTPAFSIGPIVKDGKQLSSPHYELNKYASLLVDSTGNALLAYLYSNVQVENNSRGINVDISAINKPSKDYGNIVIYTKEYTPNSPGANNTYFDLTEIVVENDIVREVRYGQPSVAIPENGYVILAAGANSFVLQGAFTPGEKVKLKTDINLNYNNIKTAIGGGTMLLKNGVETSITQSVSGKSQRTALGITADKKMLIVTVDGRKSPFIGMDEKDMQAYMKALGAKDAMMLDGGGSTQLMADGKIQNTMASAERSLVNGLTIKNTAPKGSISQIEISVLNETIFQGDKVELAIRAFDASKNPIDITTPSFQVSGEGISGSFDGRYFTPTSSGNGNIVASYGGVTGKIPVEVLKKNAPDSKMVQTLPASGIAAVFGSMSGGESIIDQAFKAKLASSASANQAVMTLGAGDNAFLGAVSAPKEAFNGAYKYKTVGNTTFISVDNRNGGVYKVKGQWDYLKGLMSKSAGNVVIVLQGSDKSADSIDQNAFDKIIQKEAKTKNVYVVYSGKSFSSRVDGNVSYISVVDYASMPKSNIYQDIKYLQFAEADGKLVYGFKPVLTP